MHYIFLGLISLLGISWFGFMGSEEQRDFPENRKYEFAEPHEVYELPDELNEISGITFFDATTLACVQDEKGRVYFYDLKEKNISRELKFDKNGDYEDVAYAKDKLFVLRSDGDIYKIKKINEDKPKVKKYETDLKAENDTEGLCYDKKKDRLLVLCKEKAGDNINKYIRAIYAFDLEDKESSHSPKIKLNIKPILKQTGHKQFKPAAIALHPIDKTFYIVDSVGGVLVQISRKGEILSLNVLSKDLLPQPEGMTFDQEGNLYISTEKASGTSAKIVLYELSE